jgi:quercetin dioxygenase-like cupin family protein
MNLPKTPFTLIDWNGVPPQEHPGETGTSTCRSFTSDDLRLRVVEYEAGYLADHWCDMGHVLHVLTGTLEVELTDGRVVPMARGESFCVSDHGDAAHRVRTKDGARAFIVD